MQTSDGYYVPRLDEFSLGFVYETAEEHGVEQHTFGLSLTLYSIAQKLEAGMIRVKLLDEDDLRALGFARCSDNPRYSDCQMYRHPTLPDVALRLRIDRNNCYVTIWEPDYNTDLYSGKCNNAYHLNRLLLDIYGESVRVIFKAAILDDGTD